MKNTGRINQTLNTELQSIIYGKDSNEAIENELKYVVKIDKAHILMLNRQKIIDKQKAKKLLNQISILEETNYAPLRNQNTPRGIYFLYEDYLRNTIGDENGGMLQFGRSRNDLKATVLKIRLREPYLLCINKIIDLIELLLKKSNEFSNIIMPIYTHYQPAVPITYGHYLAAVAEELMNIVSDILNNKEMKKSPLGAGAVGGTSVHIDTQYTAELLGFSETINNSIVGVGSRKVILDLLAYQVEVESLISRCCEDYLMWTSSDLQFVQLPDNLVGGSSMMPNKRNAFLFENIRGRCSKALGSYVSSVTAMKGEPFTNSIAVGTEAVAYIWSAFSNLYEILHIFEEIIAAAKPNRERMLFRSEEGYTLATEYANYLTLQFGEDFRNAHKIIGGLVKNSIETGTRLETLLNDWIYKEKGVPCEIELDISSSVAETNYGWGPGRVSQMQISENNWKRLKEIKLTKRKTKSNWEVAEEYLNSEIIKV